ncbi:MAG TPA: hypothetical protein VMI13_05720 [Solirubrobacteraceae bacterium]|nr:hypothetical protein [Solirubrobacteraceae bacterium]
MPSPPSTSPRSAEVPALPSETGNGTLPPHAPASNRSRGPRWAPSPDLPGRELALAALAGVALALLTTWPLVLHLSSRIAPDLGDPVRTAWQVAWVGHALFHDPLHIFDSNAFYPHPLSLAFSDSLLGYGPVSWIGTGTGAALVRYNLLFLFAWSLSFFGAYLLGRELGLRRIAAAAAGLAFAYAPYRITEAGHLHVISSGGIALALFLLLRGYRRDSRALVLGGWVVSAWQVSLGFTLGLQYCYLLAVLALIFVVVWARRRRRERARSERRGEVAPSTPLIPRRLLGVTLAGIALLGVVAAYQSRPYVEVSHKYPTAKRTIKEVKNYSSKLPALLAAPAPNRVWGSVTVGMRDKVHSKNEDVFFPGGLILALAIVGLFCSTFTPRLRLGLALGVAVCSILALGMGLNRPGYPYRLMYDFAPGWNGVRVPGRVFTTATLFYAMLAGAGVQLLLGALSRWWKSRPAGRSGVLVAAPAAVGVVLLIGILGEGAGRMAHPVVPQPAAAETRLAGPVLDLPTNGVLDRLWQYYSTDGFPKIPIGNSTFDIPAVDDLRGGMLGFPDKASVEKLRWYGIKTVVLHTVIPNGLPPERGHEIPEPPDPVAAAAKPIAGLGITRRQVGSVVIYEIGPGPKALHGTD